ncbi:hypothetical protein HYH03_008124 [Edaphochlamys debaryana]|uniref:Uncharacterized protein n=1 Tax=Edaphochlamys debaryana TaxID=47281 RepID=A0A835XYX7_9CHLO|nr:hypothetical protein HYH03_008124 [Edaphochlamys debaryana]|eukprot:KAG2493607.1 hypothetical protein HYH03_008124 [Edaphochlamys debaryana]
MFLQMLRAKRDTAPDRRTLDFPLPADPANIEAKVAAWRRSRGFLDPGPGSGGGGGSGAAGASSSAEGASGSGAGASSGAALAGSLQRPDLSRPNLSKRGRAGAAAVTFTRINPGEKPPVYACDQTGWVHVCGDACTEGLVDAGSELLVCPVSGQTTDRLVHECEEEGEGDCARGPGEEDALGFIGGGFGAFFMAGYECRDEKALNRLLGYKAL